MEKMLATGINMFDFDSSKIDLNKQTGFSLIPGNTWDEESLDKLNTQAIIDCKFLLGIDIPTGNEVINAGDAQLNQAWLQNLIDSTGGTIFGAGFTKWMEIAKGELGVKESKNGSNPRIEEYQRATGSTGKDINDETAWCGSFMGWVMKNAGYSLPAGPAWARGWLKFGVPCEPKYGCIVVLSRGPKWGHVGFLIDQTPTHVKLLAGNQSDAVNISSYPKSRVLGYRWPSK